jgi:uncharacterized protein YifN (PemK superfamily)
MITSYRAGSVFILNYDQFGFEAPEMIKRRMVVVVSSKSLKRNPELVTVVPLSTTPPMHANARHNVPLGKDYYWGTKNGKPLWAKCDMVLTTSIRRLEHVNAFSRSGQNHLPVPELNRDDLRRVRLGVATAIDLDDLIVPEAKEELTSYLKRFRAKLSSFGRRARGKRQAPPENRGAVSEQLL